MPSVDSPGHSTPAVEKILIFDLDGTLLSVNSFPYWVRYFFSGKFHGLSGLETLTVRLCATAVMLERKLFKTSHYIAKYKLQRIWNTALQSDPEKQTTHEFCNRLKKYIRPDLQTALIAAKQNGFNAILATAAAGEYALHFGQMLGFDHILTTPLCTENILRENVREEKRDRVLALLATHNMQTAKRIFFTDHEEDLPLIAKSDLVFWFGDDTMLGAVQQNTPSVKIIKAHKMSAQEIIKVINDA